MDDRLRHTDDEVTAGREGLAAVRAQLGWPPRRPSHEHASLPTRETVELPGLEAEMAWGAERDRLQARVLELETEIDRLRGTLAAILRHAADAVHDTPPMGTPDR